MFLTRWQWPCHKSRELFCEGCALRKSRFKPEQMIKNGFLETGDPAIAGLINEGPEEAQGFSLTWLIASALRKLF